MINTFYFFQQYNLRMKNITISSKNAKSAYFFELKFVE